jgi:hypothetical protein
MMTEPDAPRPALSPAVPEAPSVGTPSHAPGDAWADAPGGAPSDPSGGPPAFALPEPPYATQPRQATILAAIGVAIVVAALGGAVGWFWALVSPRLQVIKSDRGFLYADAEPEQPVAADGIFLFVGLGLGILIAILVWVLLRRYRGVAMLVALTAGSLGGSVLAFWVGHKIGMSEFNAIQAGAPIGAELSAPVTLHITDLKASHLWPPSGVIAAQALAAAFVYTSLAGFSAYEDLGRHNRRQLAAPEPGPHAPPAEPSAA